MPVAHEPQSDEDYSFPPPLKCDISTSHIPAIHLEKAARLNDW